jgi:hypothetical protein
MGQALIIDIYVKQVFESDKRKNRPRILTHWVWWSSAVSSL